MYSYSYDSETGGIILNSSPQMCSKEPRPVYYRELDILGFDKHWNYAKDDSAPYLWAEASNYFYRGRLVAKVRGGALYTPPEIEILDSPEPGNAALRAVDVVSMIKKNRDLMEKLVAETIKKIYNTYVDYAKRVDVFYVAFSGGKDSVVVLDLAQRALPHNEFEVVFGDTDMEFPTTRTLVSEIISYCSSNGIVFHTAKSAMPATESWDLFGPPARRIRWCCTVHKTAPVINKLCELHHLEKIHAMMITGVRGDESITRSEYDEVSLGKKLPGQHSFHPILDWSSAEVFLYTFMQALPMNEAYKYGFNRVGCIMCPNSSEKHEYIKRCYFPEMVDLYSGKIVKNSKKDLSGDNAARFLEIGGWKTRLSGRELKSREKDLFEYEISDSCLRFVVTKLKMEWKTWYKTIGTLHEFSPNEYQLEYDGVVRKCVLHFEGDRTVFEIENEKKTKNSIEFVLYFKAILAKTQYCIQCMTCVAECPGRNIQMSGGILTISDRCVRCRLCLKMPNGCLLYNSIKGGNSMKPVKGLNRYLSVGVDVVWVKSYLSDQTSEPGNRKTDVMFVFMNDAGITASKKLTDFGRFLCRQDMDSTAIWALILCNLVYSPAFGWYVKNIPFNERYLESQLALDLGEDTSKKDGGKKSRGEFWNGFKTILDSNGAFKEIGFGVPEIEAKVNKNGDEKKSMLSILRLSWQNPEPRVILYSLYKFAEACGAYHQFTLTRLLDHDVDSDGVSPTEIFGIGREAMEKILTGLTINYPDFINASFTLGLDNITLDCGKTSKDVLALF